MSANKSRTAYRVVLAAVVLWVAASPFMWRRSLVERFGDIPWGEFAIPLSLSLVAALGAVPLWNLNRQWAGVVAIISTAYAVLALAGSGIGNGGLFLNAALLASVAVVPVVMHSNSEFKRRRAKTHAP